jgi:hypothetical protein
MYVFGIQENICRPRPSMSSPVVSRSAKTSIDTPALSVVAIFQQLYCVRVIRERADKEMTVSAMARIAPISS